MLIWDAVEVEAIPASATTVIAYIDGGYNTLAACRARFPHAAILTATVTGRSRATFCDVEYGDATPAIAAQGVRDGLYSTVYSSLFTKPELDKALKGLRWDWFAANPTGVPHLVPGSVATQYAWPHQTGGNYDISITNGVWPGVTPPLPSAPTEEQLMQAIIVNGITTVYAASPNNHLLEFSKLGSGWSVIDVTATIAKADPAAPYFLVES